MIFPILGPYAVEIKGATPILMGLALGGYGVTQAIFQIPMSWLSDFFGRKRIIIIGLTIFCLGSVVAGMASNIHIMIIGRILQGAGAIAGSVMALILDNTRESQRTKSMAIVGASIGISFSVAMVLGPVVAAFFGISGVFYLTALLSILGIGLVSFGVPSQTAIFQRRPASALYKLEEINRVCRDLKLQKLFFGIFSLHFILASIFSFIPSSLEVIFNISRDIHWKLYLPVVLGSLLSVLLILNFFEKSSRSETIFILFIFILSLSVLGFLSTKTLVIYTFFLFIFFVAFNYFEAILPAMVGSQVSQINRGLALGLFSTSQFLGTALGGVFGGWIFQFDSSIWRFCLIPIICWLFLESRPAWIRRV